MAALSSTLRLACSQWSRPWGRIPGLRLGIGVRSATHIAKGSVVAHGKEEPTPVGEAIASAIKATGPMSVAQYMRQALQSPLGGYYHEHRGDLLGAKGDFTTSPEISQMFGELIGVWYVATWRQQQQQRAKKAHASTTSSRGTDQPIRIIELGPGRGTLMADMLRAMKRFSDFYERVQEVHFIESSAALRQAQRSAVQVPDMPEAPQLNQSYRSEQGLSVQWHARWDDLALAESGPCYNIVMAHEFFDALPVYRLQFTDKGWREIMVDVDETQASDRRFRFVLSPNATHATKSLTIAPHFPKTQFQPGNTLEISPDSWGAANAIAKLIQEQGGSGLVVDYGDNHPFADSLRAVSKHKFTHPLTRPGTVDLTADVDFSLLRNAMAGRVSCYGPVQQNMFLGHMGIETRLSMLLKNTSTLAERNDLVTGFNRLVDPLHMGKVYKFMSIVDSPLPPVAFV
ncbi:hypothetical protein H4R34_001259 [Dimargaris verticillata]|uniref:Protein arginine methyltransferase NDUFAF7 n=1 Tax=Dimargaris verticillata TaxID=2761393 RepID=A0A9W8B3X8_9FUNG|nr:hypothetical protein H4R34_001259 [Dimargaris verticillata]